MQTFLPYESFYHSADVLDRQRLGKQRVECLQILQVLHGKSRGWVNHPAVKMWKGYEAYLFSYTSYICEAWIRRGYNDSILEKIQEFKPTSEYYRESLQTYPPFLGDQAFHASHRSNLLRKNPVWYGQFGWSEPNDLPYIWKVES
jgi:hypothetical protein